VAIRVAHALGLPVVNGLKKIELQEGNVRCERDAGGARDVYVVPMPAVLTTLEGLNLPRYPSVPGRLRAKSKPLAVSEPARPEQKLEKLRLVVPPGQGKQAEILGEGPAAAPKVVELMQSLGVA
jgi:electron transfer flavoprotein beta subunit